MNNVIRLMVSINDDTTYPGMLLQCKIKTIYILTVLQVHLYYVKGTGRTF
jgi:hypothetical protein